MNNSIRSFTAAELRSQAKFLNRHISGIYENSDTEPVHQARISSRKIRTLFRLFPEVFPEKRFRRWKKQIRKITRKLGAARDLDVLILSLSESPQNEARDNLLPFLGRQRNVLQPEVEKALEAFTGSKVNRDMLSWSRKHTGSGTNRHPSLFTRAADELEKALSGFLDRTGCFTDPGDLNGHHKARIKLKHLRYSLEIFNRLYRKELTPFYKTAKSIQTILGEKHDCEVWEEVISQFSTDQLASGSLEVFLAEKQKERDTLYSRLLSEWESSIETRTWENLISVLESRSDSE